jgi:hypothetical protein
MSVNALQLIATLIATIATYTKGLSFYQTEWSATPTREPRAGGKRRRRIVTRVVILLRDQMIANVPIYR